MGMECILLLEKIFTSHGLGFDWKAAIDAILRAKP